MISVTSHIPSAYVRFQSSSVSFCWYKLAKSCNSPGVHGMSCRVSLRLHSLYGGLTLHPAPTRMTAGALGLCGLEVQRSANEEVGLRSIRDP